MLLNTVIFGRGFTPAIDSDTIGMINTHSRVNFTTEVFFFSLGLMLFFKYFYSHGMIIINAGFKFKKFKLPFIYICKSTRSQPFAKSQFCIGDHGNIVDTVGYGCFVRINVCIGCHIRIALNFVDGILKEEEK